MGNAVIVVATRLNADGHREVLGVTVATNETATAWTTFFADLIARGLHDVRAYANCGLVTAIVANLPGAAWATLPHPLRRQRDGRDPQIVLGLGQSPAALGLRPAQSPSPTDRGHHRPQQ